MSDILGGFLSLIFTVILEFAPYLVIGTILYINYRLMRQMNPSLSGDARPIFAYLGGFLVFIIGFVAVRTSNTIQLGIERGNFWLIFGSTFVGVVLGIGFLLVARSVAQDNAQNWFIFFTNAAASLALMVYIFVGGLREVFVYLMLGFALGVVIQLVHGGNFLKIEDDKPSSKGNKYLS